MSSLQKAALLLLLYEQNIYTCYLFGFAATQHDIQPLIKPEFFLFWLRGGVGDYYKLLPDIFITSGWEIECYVGNA